MNTSLVGLFGLFVGLGAGFHVRGLVDGRKPDVRYEVQWRERDDCCGDERDDINEEMSR